MDERQLRYHLTHSIHHMRRHTAKVKTYKELKEWHDKDHTVIEADHTHSRSRSK